MSIRNTGNKGIFWIVSAGTLQATNNTPLVVNNSRIGTGDIVLLTVQTATGANAGQAEVVAKAPGVSFTINSGAADTSVYRWVILRFNV